GAGGTVRVSLARQGATAVVRVSDDGPGVPAAERERIFEPGVSTKSGRRTRGIGLTLVRQVVTRRGGTICVEDAPGGGPRLVTLPPPRIAATSRALEAAR